MALASIAPCNRASGGPVGRDGDDDGVLEPARAERVADEVAHLPAALADQRDDGDLGARVPRHHAEQRALADAAAGEQTDALTPTEREQGVDRAHADVERAVHGRAGKRVDGCRVPRPSRAVAKRAVAVDRLALGVEHAAEKRLPRRHGERPVQRTHARAGAHAVEGTCRHEQGAGAIETDYLGLDGPSGTRLDQTARTDRRSAALRLQRQPEQRREGAVDGQGLEVQRVAVTAQALPEAFGERGHGSGGSGA